MLGRSSVCEQARYEPTLTDRRVLVLLAQCGLEMWLGRDGVIQSSSPVRLYLKSGVASFSWFL